MLRNADVGHMLELREKLADAERKLIDSERRRSLASEALDRILSIGEVYVYPPNWDCAGMGGLPTIDDYQRINLAELDT